MAEQNTHVVDITVREQTSTAGNDRNDSLGEALGAFESSLLLLLGDSLLRRLGLEVGLLLLEEVDHGGIGRPGGWKPRVKVVYYSGFRGEGNRGVMENNDENHASSCRKGTGNELGLIALR